ncbi:unnamed protein product, partial [Rotaria sp. Silwood1]
MLVQRLFAAGVYRTAATQCYNCTGTGGCNDPFDEFSSDVNIASSDGGCWIVKIIRGGPQVVTRGAVNTSRTGGLTCGGPGCFKFLAQGAAYT